MRTSRTRVFLNSTTTRLAATYLVIIMLMSIGFSVIFYVTSYRQLGRQIPPPAGVQLAPFGQFEPRDIITVSPQVTQYLQQRINEGRAALRQRLLLLNIGALCVGSVLSYTLARRTLRPIEEAMEAQTQFVSDASHELRTPLTAIQTSNEVALRKPKLSLAEAKQLIAQDTEDIKHLKALSDGLLNLASQQRADNNFQPVSLQEVGSEAMTQVVGQATVKGVTVDDKLDDLRVMGNKSSLVQLMVIFLDNAVKYSHENGSVYLTSHKKDRYAYINVQDKGMGIDANALPHIFQRFYQADSARTGSKNSGHGLGLAIAEQIIDRHHGTITARSTTGKGSTFTIKLPLA